MDDEFDLTEVVAREVDVPRDQVPRADKKRLRVFLGIQGDDAGAAYTEAAQ